MVFFLPALGVLVPLALAVLDPLPCGLDTLLGLMIRLACFMFVFGISYCQERFWSLGLFVL